MKYLNLQAIVILFLISCSNKNNFTVSIPSTLAGNNEVERYISEYSSCASALNNALLGITEMSVNNKIENFENLTLQDKIRVGKVSVQVMRLSSKIEDFKTQGEAIKSTLTKEQVLDFESLCTQIEKHIVAITPSNMDTAKLAAFQEHFETKKEIQMTTDSLDALRGYALGSDEDPYASMKKEKKQGKHSKVIGFAFPIAILLITGFIVILGIKRFISRLKDFKDYGFKK